MTLHNRETGKPFEIEPDTITMVWLLMGMDGTEVHRGWGKVACLEDLDKMEALLKEEGLKFAKLHYMYYDWAYFLINTDQIKYLEAKGECTMIQVSSGDVREILVDLPMDKCLNLLAAARR